MEKFKPSKECVLCRCEDGIYDILNRMIFLREIYNFVGFGFYESLLSLVFEDMDKFIDTLQKIMDEIDEVREKPNMEQ
ncbi:MAG: hypothetical protein IJX55_00005 [Clostridia bacterium]|nr:hypothetical protein [Clostridia bacterium]MBQ9746672.1 hypothetical protein [Clostridia bacterium]